MSETQQQLYVTEINGFKQLYVGSLQIVEKVNSVYYQGAIYQARNNEIATENGKKSVISLVQRGEKLYLLS